VKHSFWSVGLAVAGVAYCLQVTGCATLRALDPGGPVSLGRSEGILVVHIRTQVALDSIKVAGVAAHRIGGGLKQGEYLWFLAATAGNYRWIGLEKKIGPYTYRWALDGPDAEWNFTIEPGKINYPGVFVVEGKEGSPALRIHTINQAAIAFAELRQGHPALLERFPMRYAGSRRDDFLDYYLEARRANSKDKAAGTR
jgi:hypothetical protein